MELRTHKFLLKGEHVVLRPMTEEDWDLLLKWNNDPEVLYFSEVDDVASRTLDEVQQIYRGVSQNAFCFIIKVVDQDIGACWLQQMNLDRILKRYPDCDCRRIDIEIREKKYWGKGYGTESIKLLTNFAFESEHTDIVFGCDITDYNHRSLKAFKKARFEIDSKNIQQLRAKAKYLLDVKINKDG